MFGKGCDMSPKAGMAFAVSLMMIIAMMVLPVPPALLDLGLAVSFGLAILIFSITIFIRHPLEFSSFPTVLLVALMLRLGLNISSTKLIIGEGHTGTAAAGNVIEGFAEFIMGGNALIGFVTFGVLLIVNFTIITKGAARMAEVGARFALDGMPGKQMAIDADLAAGTITHEEAMGRRQKEHQETAFLGSLDGASKFVKGDAVAGILIIILNLVVGTAAGVLSHGMSFGHAVETYSILTVGDGLVSQMPAVVISIATALLLARGGASESIHTVALRQLGQNAMVLYTVAALLFFFSLVPGLPTLPFLIGAAILGAAGYFVPDLSVADQAEAAPEADATPEPVEPPMGDVLDIDDIHVEFAPDLVDLALDPATGLETRILSMRRHIAEKLGFLIPEIRLTDAPDFLPGAYAIHILGVNMAEARVRPGQVLAIASQDGGGFPTGEQVSEPVYGAPAYWLPQSDQDEAALDGMTIVTPGEVVATHLLETIKRNLSKLLTAKALRRQINELCEVSNPARAQANKALFDEMIPEKVPMEHLHAVLRMLLDEDVSIRNLPLILEAIAEARAHSTRIEDIFEHVRQRLGFQLISDLRRQDGSVPLLQLAQEWEDSFLNYQVEGAHGRPDVALPPEVFNRLVQSVSAALGKAAELGETPGLITSTHRRRFLRGLLAAKGISIPVLSYEEVGSEAQPTLVGVVEP